MIDIEDNEDDEIYFTPVSSTNLASLFNTSMVPPNTERDASLTYKPPKQPNAKPEQPNVKPKLQSSVILFKEVHAFQLINKEYSPTGKCGLAIIGNEQSNAFQLLIYKQKNNIISSTKITSSLEIKVQKNNYITITDDKKLIWTVHLNSEADLNEFTSVIISKCGCKVTKHEEKTMKEEVTKPSELSESIFKNNEIKSEIVPSNILAPCETKSEKPPSNVDSDTSDSSGTTKKADILSRVAKMGKKIISKTSVPTPDSSDVEDTPHGDSKYNNPKNNNISNTKQIAVPNSLVPEKVVQKIPEQYLPLRPSLHQVLIPYPDAPPMVYSTTQLTPDQLNMYFVENRTHNSEIRMSMMKLQSGLEEVANMIKRTEPTKYDNGTQTEDGFLVDITVENKRLGTIIAENEKTIVGLKTTNEAYKKMNDELIHKETEHSYEIASLTQETARCAYEEHKLNLKIKEQQLQLTNQVMKLTEYEERLNKFNAAYGDSVQIKKSKLPVIKDNIKDQMNLFYNEACGVFKGDVPYDGNHIKKVLAPVIIDNTYKILNIINELFTVNED